mmetsp:Transcript_3231/g.9129  ORF Transcript_3231/g.9129 Transcript_3231/m.9129 type:complete len:200 (+) Transcript_3231:61-660(+)
MQPTLESEAPFHIVWASDDLMLLRMLATHTVHQPGGASSGTSATIGPMMSAVESEAPFHAVWDRVDDTDDEDDFRRAPELASLTAEDLTRKVDKCLPMDEARASASAHSAEPFGRSAERITAEVSSGSGASASSAEQGASNAQGHRGRIALLRTAESESTHAVGQMRTLPSISSAGHVLGSTSPVHSRRTTCATRAGGH